MKNYIFDFGMVLFNYDTKYMTSLYTENIDDNPKNIEAAQQLKLHTYLFDGDSGNLLRLIESAE